ncbi:MAG: DUF2934 domain-containing protein [Methylorubrum populi]
MDVAVEITFEQIRERAYELWERHHRPDGFEIELWLMAERELRAERERKPAPAPRSGPTMARDDPMPSPADDAPDPS